MYFSLPSTQDANGNITVKEIYWKMNGPQVPVVLSPWGDGETPRVPLNVRLVQEDDFL